MKKYTSIAIICVALLGCQKQESKMPDNPQRRPVESQQSTARIPTKPINSNLNSRISSATTLTVSKWLDPDMAGFYEAAGLDREAPCVSLDEVIFAGSYPKEVYSISDEFERKEKMQAYDADRTSQKKRIESSEFLMDISGSIPEYDFDRKGFEFTFVLAKYNCQSGSTLERWRSRPMKVTSPQGARCKVEERGYFEDVVFFLPMSSDASAREFKKSLPPRVVVSVLATVKYVREPDWVKGLFRFSATGAVMWNPANGAVIAETN